MSKWRWIYIQETQTPLQLSRQTKADGRNTKQLENVEQEKLELENDYLSLREIAQ